MADQRNRPPGTGRHCSTRVTGRLRPGLGTPAPVEDACRVPPVAAGGPAGACTHHPHGQPRGPSAHCRGGPGTRVREDKSRSESAVWTRVFRLPHESRRTGFRIASAAREPHRNGKKQTPPAPPPRGSRSPQPVVPPPPHPRLPTCQSAPRGQKSAPNCGTAWCRRALRSQVGHSELAERRGPQAPRPAPPLSAPPQPATPRGASRAVCVPRAPQGAGSAHGERLASLLLRAVVPGAHRHTRFLPASRSDPPHTPHPTVRLSFEVHAVPRQEDSPRQECASLG